MAPPRQRLYRHAGGARRAGRPRRRGAAPALALVGALCLLPAAACGAGTAAPASSAASGPVTHCGWDGGGTCPSLGRGQAPGLHPGTFGNQVEVNLAPYYTSDAVTTLGAGLRYGGLGGAAFPARLFPSAGTLDLTVAGDLAVRFFIPPFGPGRRSAISLARPVTVRLPPGEYTALWLLEAGVGGNIGPVHAAVLYARGAPTLVPVTFGDWCNGGLALEDQPPEYVGVVLPEVLTTSAALAASATASGLTAPASPQGVHLLREVRAQCGLWAEEVPLPPAAAPAVALRLPASPAEADPLAYVMALTVQTGPAPVVSVPSP
jgi:hypothetical protein